MKSFLIRLCASSCLCTLNACAYGVLYTKKTEPLTVNIDRAAACTVASKGYSDLVAEPLTGVGLRVEWASNAIGDIAKRNNLKTIHYADIETYTILLGLFQRRTVTVYGEAADGL